jgi:hypothetical protein
MRLTDKGELVMSRDLDSFIAVPLPTSLVIALLARSTNVSDLLVNIASDFLERTKADRPAISASTGVYWESLFLPSGTQIRTKYFGEFKVALIEEDSIVWNDNHYPSFAKLVNEMRGGTINNAWKELQIKRPTDNSWVPALSLRR